MLPSEDVTVFLMNYNHARFLPRSIGAILGQSVRPREVLILDDASSDDSIQVIESFARRDPIVRLLRNERNLGVVESFNKHFAAAQGAYLITAGADDYLLPHMIEKSMSMLRRHPEAGMSTAWCSVYDERTGEFYPNRTSWCEAPRFLSPEEIARVMGPTGLASHCAIFKRSEFARVGAMRPELRWHSDWFHNLIIAFRSGVCYISEPLAWLRVAPESYSNSGMRGAQQIEVLAEILRTVLRPEFRDVLVHFQESGVLGALGPNLIRAAVLLPDHSSPDVLRLINSLCESQYLELLDDDSEDVRKLAELFAGPRWRRDLVKKLGGFRSLAEQHEHLHGERDRARAEVHWMQTSKFWRLRNRYMQVIGLLLRQVGRTARPGKS